MFENIIQKYTLLISLAAGISLVVMLASVMVIPAILIRMRPDYFVRDCRKRPVPAAKQTFFLPVIILARNFLGILLIIAGIVMLVTPGQGLMSIFVGLLVMDFPGKYRFERWLIRRRHVHRSVNWLRKKAGRPPVIVPES
ncbi:MAG: PGPGW domain-containing protein [Verrucomicrobiota bacterium]